MEVRIKIERRTPALQEADSTGRWCLGAQSRGLVGVVPMDGFGDDRIDLGREALIRMEPVTQRNWERYDKRAVGCERQDMFAQVSGGLGHPLGAATWTETKELTIAVPLGGDDPL